MWRPGSPQGYEPPRLNPNTRAPTLQQHRSVSAKHPHTAPSPFQQQSRGEANTQDAPRAYLEQGRQQSHSQPFQSCEAHSAESSRPGTLPTAAQHCLNSANTAIEPSFGYQPLLEPLLPVSDLLQSSPRQQPAQDQQASKRGPHPPLRAQSFPIAPSIPAPLPPLQRPPSHHSHSPQHSEPSQGTLQGLNVPLEPHERQLLTNLLHRSYSTRSQDRGSDHSLSSASTQMDTQPLPLPRTWSARQLTSGSLMMHDTSALQAPHDLSRCDILSCALSVRVRVPATQRQLH